MRDTVNADLNLKVLLISPKYNYHQLGEDPHEYYHKNICFAVVVGQGCKNFSYLSSKLSLKVTLTFILQFNFPKKNQEPIL